MAINISFSIDDIDAGVAYSAFKHSNSSARELALKVRQRYVDDMQSLVDELSKFVTEDNLSAIEIDCLAYKQAYITKFTSWLRSRANFVSPFIAGRSKFKHSMIERGERSDKVRATFSDWEQEERLRLIKKYRPIVIKSRPGDDELKSKIEQLQQQLKQMRAYNKLAKNSELSREDKIERIVKLGFDKDTVTMAVSKNHYFLIHEIDDKLFQIKKLKKLLTQGNNG